MGTTETTTESVLRRLEAAARLQNQGLAMVSAAHAERVSCVRLLRGTMTAVQIAELLGVSRQQVHKLLRGE